MADVIASIGCLVFVWGLPILSVSLIVKMLLEVQAERRKRVERRTRQEEGVWPPPPDDPAA